MFDTKTTMFLIFLVNHSPSPLFSVYAMEMLEHMQQTGELSTLIWEAGSIWRRFRFSSFVLVFSNRPIIDILWLWCKAAPSLYIIGSISNNPYQTLYIKHTISNNLYQPLYIKHSILNPLYQTLYVKTLYQTLHIKHSISNTQF